jgi:hypothetical protein
LADPAHPQPIAFAMPHEASAAVQAKIAHYAPRAETAVERDGWLWVSDMETGLYVYRLAQ